jgi:hypothetical protein
MPNNKSKRSKDPLTGSFYSQSKSRSAQATPTLGVHECMQSLSQLHRSYTTEKRYAENSAEYRMHNTDSEAHISIIQGTIMDSVFCRITNLDPRIFLTDSKNTTYTHVRSNLC